MAQDEANKGIIIENEKRIKSLDPTYPIDAARGGQEGWVDVRFIINEQGKVVDPHVVSSTGVKSLEKEALNAIKHWRYEPATLNGQPFELSENYATLAFFLSNPTKKTSKKFYRKYKRMLKALEDNNLALSQSTFSELDSGAKWNLFENLLLLQVKYQIALHLDDRPAQYEAIKEVTAADSNEKYLDEGVFLEFLRLRFITAIQNEYYYDAYSTLVRLKEREDANDVLEQLARPSSELENYIKGDQVIVSKGKLRFGKPFSQKMYREQFSITDVKGDLSALRVRCETKTAVYSFEKDRIWQAPVDAEKCVIWVYGMEGAEFTIVEQARNSQS